MKQRHLLQLTFILFSFLTHVATAKPAKAAKKFGGDPEILDLRDYAAKPITFITLEPTPAFLSKKGNVSRKLITFPAGTTVKLQSMTMNAFRVVGNGKHGKVAGWVSPKKLTSKDPNFVENLKQLYIRQITVRGLIESNEVAIGMTLDEVMQSLGEPTKKSVRITKEGKSGSWEYLEYEIKKHFNYFQDPATGQTYKRFSHTTKEEKSNTTVEFEKGLVSAISSMENNADDKMKIIVPPIILGW